MTRQLVLYQFKYLAVAIDEILTFECHIDAACDKTHERLDVV